MKIQVNVKMLHLDTKQQQAIQEHYATCTHFSQLYSDDIQSQQDASRVMQEQGLNLRNLADLGNGWSTRWSTRGGNGTKLFTRILIQW
jgi:hypothetical protein